MRYRRVSRIPFPTVLAVGLVAIGVATAQAPEPAEFRAIYKELVEINTTDSAGDTSKAAEAMAARLKAGKPLLLLAHLDVVEARREDWSFDPFKLTEKDGYFYGRGTIDDKAMAAIFVDAFIRLRREGFVPQRDLILGLTADEELGATSKNNGVRWLLANHRNLIDAEMAINEGGGGELRDGRHVVLRVQTSEKVPLNFRLQVTNKGGHSSRPERDNAIYRLAEGLARLGKFDFPFALNETTRAFFARSADQRQGADQMRAILRTPPDADAVALLSKDSGFNALVRTTCVATRLEGGHANNALPQMARAVVNCRILPGERAEEVQRTIARVVADDQITVTPTSEPIASPPSPLDPRIMAHVQRLTDAMFPGALVIPTMSTGATDGRFLRNAGIPTYGVSGIFTDASDNRTHGRDERIGIRDLYAGRDFLHNLVKVLASGS